MTSNSTLVFFLYLKKSLTNDGGAPAYLTGFSLIISFKSLYCYVLDMIFKFLSETVSNLYLFEPAQSSLFFLLNIKEFIPTTACSLSSLDISNKSF
jgi:uncharacterized membrane protein